MLAVLDEHQIFRIDHYLGKETVQNVLAFRFANGHVRAGLEPQLRRPRADHRGRGHRRRLARGLLRHARARCATSCRTTCSSCCTLLCMEPPVSFTADEVRDEKVKVLHAIKIADARRRSRT